MDFFITAYQYLNECKIKIERDFLQQRMQSHPDYPSLVSLTDALDELHISYSTVIIDKDKLHELQFPLLAHTTNNGSEDFEIINNLNSANDSEFLKRWNGIVLIAESISTIRNKEHNALQKEKRGNGNKIVIAISALTVIYLSVFLFHFDLTVLLLSFLNALGIFISALIVMRSMGKDNILIQKLCITYGKYGCDKLLQSKAASIFKGAGWGDIGLVYFTGIFLCLLLANISGNSVFILPLLLIPFTLSFAFTFFSVWYQWRVVKNWCKMCLIVVGIVWLQSLTLIDTFSHFVFPTSSLT